MRKSVAVLMSLMVAGMLVKPLNVWGADVDIFSSEFMERTAAKAVEEKKKLYIQFLPSPDELGPGWLLPWQIPSSLRKFDSE
ncbi:hypothetical protein IBX65_08850, partial [Candidatus Aerophobetes bacterium]|nr:hypothetical protein [Candidatus Aerophobetes bacterium]